VRRLDDVAGDTATGQAPDYGASSSWFPFYDQYGTARVIRHFDDGDGDDGRSEVCAWIDDALGPCSASLAGRLVAFRGGLIAYDRDEVLLVDLDGAVVARAAKDADSIYRGAYRVLSRRGAEPPRAVAIRRQGLHVLEADGSWLLAIPGTAVFLGPVVGVDGRDLLLVAARSGSSQEVRRQQLRRRISWRSLGQSLGGIDRWRTVVVDLADRSVVREVLGLVPMWYQERVESRPWLLDGEGRPWRFDPVSGQFDAIEFPATAAESLP
jgi:hypothetical protein